MRRINTALLIASMIFAAQCARVHVGNRTERSTPKAQADATEHDEDVTFNVAVDPDHPPTYVTRDRAGARLWKATSEFYARRRGEPAWSKEGKPGKQVNALAGAIRAAAKEGLDPELYNISALDARKASWAAHRKLAPQEISDVEPWLTYLYMRYASDLALGLVDEERAKAGWNIKPQAFDPVAHLETALREKNVAESLDALIPADGDYRGLREALADYRALAARGGWPAVPPGMKLKPGQQSADVAPLARRLAASGDYKGPVPEGAAPAAYSADLQEAVKDFQRRHGLADDGVVGPAVVAELNVPVDARVRQIALNMERWRWLPRDRGDRHILVNIPEMHLEVRDHGSVPLSMRVVVGKPDTPTPVFSENMKYLVFAPYWNIPEDIAKKETLPRAMQDPEFLDRSNMEVVDKSGKTVDPESVDLNDLGKYRLRQRPGTSNSLGLVKFMLPNEYDVYLHDTPAESLFARASRPFSHGCVRLEAPEKLAMYVLGDQPEWTPERIAEAMHAENERTVKLTTPIPVYIGYWTARASGEGRVEFRKDVYDFDAPSMAALLDREDRARKSAAGMLAMNGADVSPKP